MNENKLTSRLGFILLSAGCAIGLGNVWKFPWMVGQGGGAAFVLIYLVFLIILGLPVMTAEFTLGRASQKSPVKMYQALQKPGQKWHIHGVASMVGNYALMSFYIVIAGWILKYFCEYTVGAGASTAGTDSALVGAAFGDTASNMTTLIIYAFAVIVIAIVVLIFEVSKVLEKVIKWMMLGLLVLMVILAIHGIRLDLSSANPGEGLKFYLLPDFSKLTPSTVYTAMNQAFFTLSLGIGSMAIFGSYIGKDRAMMGESVRVIALDTLAAITAGFIIFPACFSFGVEPDAGASLIFVTLPQVFNSMELGRLWGALFFLFFTFAAFSTVLAVVENCVAMCMDAFGWSRKKACIINLFGLMVLVMPVILGFTVWSDFHPFGGSTDMSDLIDFYVSYLALPLGSMIYVIYVTRRKGFGWKKFVEEANTGKGLKVRNWLFGYMKWVLPVIILVICGLGLIDRFGIEVNDLALGSLTVPGWLVKVIVLTIIAAIIEAVFEVIARKGVKEE